jgi:SAM-dependent methyltransferase
MNTITYKDTVYPAFQAQGNAAQFAIPYALQFCKGLGYDIGFCKEAWKLSGAIGIDSSLDDGFHAMKLPQQNVDYIFSSHCLEHVDDWVATLLYWLSCIKKGGVLFLYLPDISQKYWRPWHNRKHLHCFTPEIIKSFLEDNRCKDIFVSGIDLNHSFMAVCSV